MGSIRRAVREKESPYGSRDPDDEPMDDDALEALGDEIATLAGEIHAGEHALLIRLERFDRHEGWKPGGHRSCAHWLSFRTGIDLGACRERVRVAHALRRLPETSAAMARGALSFSKVRALTRVARPETEADLLPLAEGATAAHLEMMMRAWRLHSRLEEEELERERMRTRKLSIVPENGMYAVHALLPADGGASLLRAVEEAEDEVYRADRAAGLVPGPDASDTERHAAAARRRADALVLLAERALAAGLGDEAGGDNRGTRAERYQVVLYVEPESMTEGGEAGTCELEDGTRVSAETARQIACDAGIVRATRDPADGSVLDVGRRTRSIPAALRRALGVRDRGCRFPGCHSRFTEGHHVEHWIDGGETKLTNTMLLCYFHHRLLHRGGWRAEWWPHGRVAFIDPKGQGHVGGEMPKPGESPGSPVAALRRRNRKAGASPGAWTASGRWRNEREIPPGVSFRAMEAGLS